MKNTQRGLKKKKKVFTYTYVIQLLIIKLIRNKAGTEILTASRANSKPIDDLLNIQNYKLNYANNIKTKRDRLIVYNMSIHDLLYINKLKQA